MVVKPKGLIVISKIIRWFKFRFFKSMHISEVSDYDLEDTELCEKCGGRCCKHCACFYSPYDFEKVNYETLSKLIEKGYVSIRYFTRRFSKQKSGVFILTIRNKGAEAVDIPSRQTGGCSVLTATGCPFSFEDRPTGGQRLVPISVTDSYGRTHLRCIQTYGIEDACREWLPYNELLRTLAYDYASDNSIVPM